MSLGGYPASWCPMNFCFFTIFSSAELLIQLFCASIRSSMWPTVEKLICNSNISTNYSEFHFFFSFRGITSWKNLPLRLKETTTKSYPTRWGRTLKIIMQNKHQITLIVQNNQLVQKAMVSDLNFLNFSSGHYHINCLRILKKKHLSYHLKKFTINWWIWS